MSHSRKGIRIARRAIVTAAGALALVGLVTLAAHARGPGWGGRQPSPDRAAVRMAEQLALTPEQEVQVRQILAESFAKRGEIREEGRKKMQSVREETDTRLSGVLTPEQMTTLRTQREERRERRRDCGMGPGGKGDGPPRGRPGRGN